jgi:hypothetical protein
VTRARLTITALLIAALLGACATGNCANASDYTPVKWTRFVQVEGQSEPIPEQWLQDPEAKIAHSLKLPDSVPKPVPFDFSKAYRKSWLPGTPKQSVQYFNHLCSTEAGEWIFRKVQNVEGFYFARPQGEPTTDTMTDPYGPEMPWIQRFFLLRGDYEPLDQARWLIQPPLYNYRFVEQPRRNTKWQAGIQEPYVRLFGYTRGYFVKPGQVVADWNEKTPMQVIGIPALTARYGYTWRGLRRERDREFGIAGGELLIYDLKTQEVLAVRRQFLIASHNPRGEGKAMWEVAGSCPQRPSDGLSTDFNKFAFDVLETIEPSTTGRK